MHVAYIACCSLLQRVTSSDTLYWQGALQESQQAAAQYEGKVSKLSGDLQQADEQAASLGISLQAAEQELREHASRLSQVCQHCETSKAQQAKHKQSTSSELMVTCPMCFNALKDMHM